MNKKELEKRIESNNVYLYATKDLNFNDYITLNELKNNLFDLLSGCDNSVYRVFVLDMDDIQKNTHLNQLEYTSNSINDNHIDNKEKDLIKLNKSESLLIAINTIDNKNKYVNFEIIDRDFAVNKLSLSLSYIHDIDMCMELEEKEEDEINDFIELYDINYIGSGSGRDVYSFLDMVIKLPNSEIGEIQNKTELEIYNKESKSSTILNPSYSLDVLDLIVQPKLDNIQGDNEEYISEYLQRLSCVYKENYRNRIIKETEEIIDKHNLLVEDFERLVSWGVNSNNELKVFDYGLTSEQFEDFYL